ncbi:sigma-70 family RNA polymerase sigma factor [Mucilaginibacter sp. RS28]|uniref:Sigma-70 family RNA polymerase sigma factor n=2 Tax=Mucilaginibacter straminoryzae TaxID=2932774 RepID=A0A9X1X777_9SPHI|nr:sigma-70 family RNA polymerase sigma factor [Mucilaginibacter straminoryzae]
MPLIVSLESFEGIFKDNYTPLYRYVSAITKDEDLAKDVLSDLFLNLWLQKDQLQIRELKPYLFRAAKHGALKAISPRQTLTQLPDDAFDIPADTFNPFEKFVAKQSIRIVEELVNKLPPLRKEMIELRLLGLKYAEIAEVLEISEKKVEYNMREAIEQLSHTISHSGLDKATIAGGLMLINVFMMLG